MQPNKKNILIIAGEASGDLHGSNLVKAIQNIDPSVVFTGIGGDHMAKAGVEILVRSADMAVVGITEVFPKMKTILGAARQIKFTLKNDHPDLLILIDYPDFNLHISKTAKRAHVPVLYYISPQVWAWRSGRVKKLAKRTDRMAVILPFEKEFYAERGVEVNYVGHPLMDTDPPEVNEGILQAGMGQDSPSPVVALIPGSRKEEINNLLPHMLDAVGILKESYPGIRCMLPRAKTIDSDFIAPYIQKAPCDIKITTKSIYHVLSECHVAIVASGTATLETAIMAVPMVILYKGALLSYMVGRAMVGVPYIGLANLVAGKKIVPELIQKDVTAERIAQEALRFLSHPEERAETVRALQAVRQRLGQGGASKITAGICMEMMAHPNTNTSKD
jgi:lipid-A-disaccharide synthase